MVPFKILRSGKVRLFGIILIIFSLQIMNVSSAIEVKDKNTIYVSNTINYSNGILIKRMLEDSLPENTPVIYTIVPRGLIVSIREDVFFQGESINIKVSAIDTLNAIINVLNEINNNCTIESHTEGHDNPQGNFDSNWEISMVRANVVTDYLVFCGKIPPDRVFSLGYGDIMPFKDNVSATKAGFDKRIDFVIFDYNQNR